MELEAIAIELRNLNTKFDKMDGKVDGIIVRNSVADSKLAVIETKMDLHSKQDDEEFGRIDNKLTTYDKLIIGFLCYSVTQLIAVIVIIVM